MARRPNVPIELTHGPFTVEEARRAGLTRNQLESRCWRRLAPATYVWTGLPDSPTLHLAAVRRRLPYPVVFAGRAAAWLHGLDFPPCDPIEVVLPNSCGTAGRVGMLVRRVLLRPGDLDVKLGLPTTSILRTLADLALRLSLTEAVVAVDSAHRLGLVLPSDLTRWLDDHRGKKGVRRLREVVGYSEPATESPMETRLRMLLVLAGLPLPQVQAKLVDAGGHLIGRADLYYPQGRLAIEYDGGTHRDSLLEDNRRQNRLLGAGYRLLRFASGDVLRTPQSVVTEVRTALSKAA